MLVPLYTRVLFWVENVELGELLLPFVDVRRLEVGVVVVDNIGERRCSGLWFPSDSSLGIEEGGVGGNPKSVNGKKNNILY